MPDNKWVDIIAWPLSGEWRLRVKGHSLELGKGDLTGSTGFGRNEVAGWMAKLQLLLDQFDAEPASPVSVQGPWTAAAPATAPDTTS